MVFLFDILINVGVDDAEGTPVPIPNTAVKLTSADNTWLEAARDDWSTPTHYEKQLQKCDCFF